MIRTAVALMAFTLLNACAAVDHPLAWTADNVRTVAGKCHFPNLRVESRWATLNGLEDQHGKAAGDKDEACLRRHIQIPKDFMFIYA